MNKYLMIFVLSALVAYSSSSPAVKRDIGLELRQQQESQGEPIYGNGIPGKDAVIVYENFEKDEQGNYNFAYKQNDLQEREETGKVAPDADGNLTLDNVVGSYEYIRPDGKKQRVEYTADKDGFRPNVIVTDA